MALPPLSTILNNAPLIIQGASSLLKLLKERNQNQDAPDTMSDLDDPDTLKDEFSKLHQRLDSVEKSNIKQAELIEALAKQNESLVNSLGQRLKYLNTLAYVTGLALVLAIVAFIFALNA